MKRIGYLAKSQHTGILRPFEWGADEEFYVKRSDGSLQMADVNDFEILEIGYFDADDDAGDDMTFRLDKEHLERRLVLLLQVAKVINDELAKMGFADDDGCVNTCSVAEKDGDGLLGKSVVDLFILANLNSTIPETEFKTDAEYEKEKVIHSTDFIPIYEKEKLDPKNIVHVTPTEYVVGGENFDDLVSAFE